MGMDAKNTCCSNILVYLQCYFLTIGYVLGTGVLGLPVTLARAGLTPLFCTMSLNLLMQILVVYLVTDALQKLVAIQLQGEPSEPFETQSGIKSSYDMIPFTKAGSRDDNLYTSDEEISELSRINNSSTASRGAIAAADIPPVDMHLLGKYFLPSPLSYPFTATVAIQVMVRGVSYALAGSQAYGQVLQIDSVLKVLPVFCWVFNFLVVFCRRLISPLVSVLTVFKGTLLLISVLIAFIMGSTLQRKITNDFRYTGDTFLIVTVAVGGIYLGMPYMYNKIGYSEHEVRYYRLSITLGVFTACVLEILWCLSALEVVPQVDPCSIVQSNPLSNTTSTQCMPKDLTLAGAKEYGEISTIPFAKVINLKHPQYNWIATVMSLFVMVSMTVSYTFNGTVLCHTVDGVINSVWKDNWKLCDIKEYISTKWIICALVNLLLLGIIFVVSIMNPKSFVQVVEKLMSLSYNSTLAFFIGIISWRCTREKYRYLNIPLPLSKFQVNLLYLMIFYFGFASIYDIVVWILQSIGQMDI